MRPASANVDELAYMRNPFALGGLDFLSCLYSFFYLVSLLSFPLRSRKSTRISRLTKCLWTSYR
jgi:hypothetical protein